MSHTQKLIHFLRRNAATINKTPKMTDPSIEREKTETADRKRKRTAEYASDIAEVVLNLNVESILN